MPQLEDGYTRIANELLEALISNRIAGEQMQCFLFIIRKTYGFKKKVDMIALSQFVTATGMKKPAVCRALSSLEKRNLIVINKDNGKSISYSINKDYNDWVALSKKITLSKKIITVDKKDNHLLSLLSTTKDTLTKDTLTKKIPINKFAKLGNEKDREIFKAIPPTIDEYRDYYYSYANEYFKNDFPVDIVKCRSNADNDWEYWNGEEWKRKKKYMLSIHQTVESAVRKKNTALKDWSQKQTGAIYEA